jgi:hypothetical protein
LYFDMRCLLRDELVATAFLVFREQEKNGKKNRGRELLPRKIREHSTKFPPAVSALAGRARNLQIGSSTLACPDRESAEGKCF